MVSAINSFTHKNIETTHVTIDHSAYFFPENRKISTPSLYNPVWTVEMKFCTPPYGSVKLPFSLFLSRVLWNHRELELWEKKGNQKGKLEARLTTRGTCLRGGNKGKVLIKYMYMCTTTISQDGCM